LECGEFSPLFPLGRLVAQAAPRQAARRITQTLRPVEILRPTTLDGDKSPAESDAKSSHSKLRPSVREWLLLF
jgi:hypothetical protein